MHFPTDARVSVLFLSDLHHGLREAGCDGVGAELVQLWNVYSQRLSMMLHLVSFWTNYVAIKPTIGR